MGRSASTLAVVRTPPIDADRVAARVGCRVSVPSHSNVRRGLQSGRGGHRVEISGAGVVQLEGERLGSGAVFSGAKKPRRDLVSQRRGFHADCLRSEQMRLGWVTVTSTIALVPSPQVQKPAC